MNNCEYNILKNYTRAQAHFRSARTNRFIGMDITDPTIDFMALAACYGLPAQRVTEAQDIMTAVEKGISSAMPNLVEIVISNRPLTG
jgi:benzoylformate decarboxylase